MLRTGLAAAAAVFLCAAPVSADEPATRSWTVAFTAPDAQDRATAYVVGDPVNGAMTLLINDVSGRLVYVDAWPMAWFHSNIPGPEGQYTVEQALDAVAPSAGRDVSSLSSAAEIADDPTAGGGLEWIETDPETYDRARRSGGPLLCYSIAHESGRCAWYDADAGQGVALWGSGV